eukprot:TRINITY_DN26239_c0_g1_i1.p1 TRINITY_DN26239_c0_g1~~TRINITY_DN26239_c0_g1_i1.p1  ORF type:complete len:329 (+),score=77.74 TRINITY_DN26239_c0_g1_i1:170-1156(+)
MGRGAATAVATALRGAESSYFLPESGGSSASARLLSEDAAGTAAPVSRRPLVPRAAFLWQDSCSGNGCLHDQAAPAEQLPPTRRRFGYGRQRAAAHPSSFGEPFNMNKYMETRELVIPDERENIMKAIGEFKSKLQDIDDQLASTKRKELQAAEVANQAQGANETIAENAKPEDKFHISPEQAKNNEIIAEKNVESNEYVDKQKNLLKDKALLEPDLAKLEAALNPVQSAKKVCPKPPGTATITFTLTVPRPYLLSVDEHKSNAPGAGDVHAPAVSSVGPCAVALALAAPALAARLQAPHLARARRRPRDAGPRCAGVCDTEVVAGFL